MTDTPDNTTLLLTWASATAAIMDSFMRHADPDMRDNIAAAINAGGHIAVVGIVDPPAVRLVLELDGQAPQVLADLKLPTIAGTA